MSRILRLSCIQPDIVLGQKEENLSKFSRMLDRTPPGLDVVCLPELFATGYLLSKAAELAEKIPGPITDYLGREALKHGVNIVGGSMLEEGDDGFYNSSVSFDRSGKIVGRYRKTHLFSLFEEPRFLKPGEEITPFQLDTAKIGVMICYDLRFPEVARKLALGGAQILFVPSEFPEPRIDHWKHLLIARAVENQIFVVGVNRVGADDNAKFFGHSLVVDPWGEVIAEAGEAEEVLAEEIDLTQIEEVRQKLPAFYDRRPEIY